MGLRFQPSRTASVLMSSSSRGPAGGAATIAVGSTTTGAEGTSASVSNSGSSSAATFNFTIPRGAIPSIGFNFDTSTTDADPGAGDVRFNHATPASVTAIYFDNADRDGNTVTTWLDSFDDSTTTAKGTLTFTPAASPSAKLVYSVSGTVVDGTGYRKVTVTHVAGTTLPSSAAHLAVAFDRTGDKGADGSGTFPGVSVDNEIPRFDGTGGTTVQQSGVSIDDSKNLAPITNDVGALGTTSLKWADLFLADGAVINLSSGDVLITHSTNLLVFSGASSGYRFDAVVAPNSSDGAALGSTALMWSDLFVASGAVINFNNGNITITHSAGDLALAGGTLTLPNTGLHIFDTNASHDLIIAAGSDLTADHTLTLTTGDADRTLTISGNHTLPGGTSAILAGAQTLTGGFKVTPYAAGTKSSGTYTPLYSDGNFQTATNGGAHTLAPQADDSTIIIQYTNNGSAGAITTSGFTKKTGDTISTTNGDDFFFFLTKVGSFSHLHVQALQ